MCKDKTEFPSLDSEAREFENLPGLDGHGPQPCGFLP